ncbi:hypothetical protein H9X57_12480 [Flavobacterium piscinae]|uniref:hypothetical protein n=1 Tax=Flavobacterium piscinae TaxID=2506424 RepID=UPI001996F098|nr:hypothetical protein [Flavobacterium piscinae]MBC8883868.1 hypothetical protein [Flavobacterium piscinae]
MAFTRQHDKLDSMKVILMEMASVRFFFAIQPKTYQAFIEPFYPSQPYTFNPADCPITLTAQSNVQYYIVDLDQNQSTNIGTPGYFLLQSTHLSTTNYLQKKYFLILMAMVKQIF